MNNRHEFCIAFHGGVPLSPCLCDARNYSVNFVVLYRGMLMRVTRSSETRWSPSIRAAAFLLSLLCFSLIAPDLARAEDASSAKSSPGAQNQEVNVVAGTWQDGKAVFSDWEFLDIFWRFARGYQPTQPIPYSHKLHIEKNNMECQYCHSGVTKSSFATIPSVDTCMGCHKLVKTDSPHIQELKRHFDQKEPVQWEPVNHLPEHVVFNHERHIKGGVGCHSCHGQVQEMDVVEKVSSLKMGFCVTCHRERGASIDCQTCHQ